MFQYRGSCEYISSLQVFLTSYNKLVNTAINMAPSEVTSANEQELWYRTYFPPGDYRKAFAKAVDDKARGVSIKFLYKVGGTQYESATTNASFLVPTTSYFLYFRYTIPPDTQHGVAQGVQAVQAVTEVCI